VLTASYSVTDNNGESDTESFSITVTGVNDTPVLSSNPTTPAVLQEASGIDNAVAGTPTSTVTISSTDADTGDVPSPLFDAGYLTLAGWALVSQNTYTKASNYGSATFNVTSGELTYTLDNNDADTQALQAGASVTESFTVAVTDLTGATTTETTNFVINGGNDQQAIIGDTTGSVTEKSGINNGTAGIATTSGNLNVNDPDGQYDDLWTAVIGASATYGTYSVTESGVWTYNLTAETNESVQELNVDQSITDTFVVTSADGGTQTITVKINGADETTTITGSATGAVTEATAGSVGISSATGTLTANDVDNTPAFTVVAAGATTNGYGTWGVNASGNWIYNLNNENSTIQALGAGATITDSFTVSTTSGTTQQVQVTITGANDAPYVSDTVHDNNVEGGYDYNGQEDTAVEVNESTINSREALSFTELDAFTFTGPTFTDYEVGSLTRTMEASKDGGSSWTTLAAVLDSDNAMPYLAYDGGTNQIAVGRQFARNLNSDQQILLRFKATDSQSLTGEFFTVLKYNTGANKITITNATNDIYPTYGIGGGDTAIYGSSANNTITTGSSADWIYAGPGDDTISAGNGADVLSYVYATGAVTVNYTTVNAGTVTGAHGTDTFTGVETFYGSMFGDVINGNSLKNTLFGAAGHDVMDGKAGNDDLQAGAGNDTITGGDGVDTIDAGTGNDLIYFDNKDIVTGGAGQDAFAFTGSASASFVASISDYNWSEGDTFWTAYTSAQIGASYSADSGTTSLVETISGNTIADFDGDLSDLITDPQDENFGLSNGTTFTSFLATFRNASGGSFS
jgi:VCBS repeat-containing protein